MTMLEITGPARQMIDQAWRQGRVLALDIGWEYAAIEATEVSWLDAADRRMLADRVPVADGVGSIPVYVARDLLPLVRRGLVITLHRAFGIWPEIAVRAPLGEASSGTAPIA
jgi:hypothetical protein